MIHPNSNKNYFITSSSFRKPLSKFQTWFDIYGKICLQIYVSKHKQTELFKFFFQNLISQNKMKIYVEDVSKHNILWKSLL